MSELSHEQKTNLIQHLLFLLDGEPPSVLEEVLKLISHEPGEKIDTDPILVHGNFYVRHDALAIISDYLKNHTVKVKAHSLYGEAGKPFQTLAVDVYRDSEGMRGSSRFNSLGIFPDPSSFDVNVKADVGPIERGFKVSAVTPPDPRGVLESGFEILTSATKYVFPKIDMEHGPSTFTIDGEVVDVNNLTGEQQERMRQTGKYGFYRLVEEKRCAMVLKAAENPEFFDRLTWNQQIFNILYSTMRQNCTMGEQGQIEKYLFEGATGKTSLGPKLARGGTPINTRTDAVEYLVHALATVKGFHIQIEGYDLKWERKSAYCSCQIARTIKRDPETNRWTITDAGAYGDNSAFVLTPERAADLIDEALRHGEVSLDDDHPFMDLPFTEVVAMSALGKETSVLVWGQCTPVAEDSALSKLFERSLLRHITKAN